MKKVKVRKLREKDYERVREMQLASFPNMGPWKREQFKGLISTFPEGQLGIEYEGKLVASSSSHIIHSAAYPETATWNELTNNGTISNRDTNGDTLYGIEIMVDPEYRN